MPCLPPLRHARGRKKVSHVARISAGKADRDAFRRTWPAACTIVTVTDKKCSAYANVSDAELTSKVYEVYRHLGEWLLGKTEADVERRYLEIGAGVPPRACPASQVVWMICLVRENLWDYLQKHAELEKPAEIFGEIELLEMLDQFFNRAIYYATLGHERAKTVTRSLLRLSAPDTKATYVMDRSLSKQADEPARGGRCVESGMRVYIHPGCAEPEALVEALMERAPYVKGWRSFTCSRWGRRPIALPEMSGSFRHNALFVGGNVREAVRDGRADYTPIFLARGRIAVRKRRDAY